MIWKRGTNLLLAILFLVILSSLVFAAPGPCEDADASSAVCHTCDLNGGDTTLGDWGMEYGENLFSGLNTAEESNCCGDDSFELYVHSDASYGLTEEVFACCVGTDQDDFCVDLDGNCYDMDSISEDETYICHFYEEDYIESYYCDDSHSFEQCYEAEYDDESIFLCTTDGTTRKWYSEDALPVEVCGDGFDNDCDGLQNEVCDLDNDGYTVDQGDCDEISSNAALINPGNTNVFCDCNFATGDGSTAGILEICGDGFDNNCNGYIDECSTNYDAISNGAQWFVCDATDSNPIFGDLNPDNYLDNFNVTPDPYIAEGYRWCGFVPNNLDDFSYVEEDVLCELDCCNVLLTESINSDFITLCNEDPLNPANCWSLFQVPDGTDDACYASCVDSFGNIMTDEDQIYNGNFGGDTASDKGSFSFNGYYGNPLTSCESGGGYSCAEGQFCSADFRPIVSSNETVCCYNDDPTIVYDENTCIDFAGDEALSCQEQGGQLIPNDPNSNQICLHTIDASNTGTDFLCCLSGLQFIDNSYVESPYTKYLCYQENLDSFFAECCWGNTCANTPPVNNFDNYNAFTGGTALHTIKSFDRSDETNVYDIVYTYNRDAGSPINYIMVSSFRSIDWIEFDTLNFDMGFIGTKFPETVNLRQGAINLCEFNLSENLKYNFSKFGIESPYVASKWHRISLDLSDCVLGMGVSSLKFNFDELSGDDYLNLSLDNIYLSSKTNSELETWYCSAYATRWINSLNPPGNFEDIDYQNFQEWGPFMGVCNDQLSFNWTGVHCCGSLTERDNYGEYYSDYLYGCFGGLSIKDNERVGSAIGEGEDHALNKILYYDSEYLTCNTSLFDDLRLSPAAEATADFLINDDNKMNLFDTKGEWYCDPKGWKKISDFNKIRLVASELFAQGESEGTYSLHCGDLNTVMNINESRAEDFEAIETDNLCVLELLDKVIIGTGIDKTNVDNFLSNNLAYFYPMLGDENSVPTQMNCAPNSGFEEFDNNHFFQECVNTGDWLNVSFNEPFGIVLITMKNDVPSGFFASFWDSIKLFFNNLFGVNPEINYVPVPKNILYGDFEELYIEKTDSQLIKAVREGKNGKYSLVVEYEGFENVSFLRDLTDEWINETMHLSALYLDNRSENNKQYITLNGSIDVYKFDWRYLTSNID